MDMAGIGPVAAVALAAAVLVAVAAYLAVRRAASGNGDAAAERDARIAAEGQAARLEEAVRRLEADEREAREATAKLEARLEAERNRAGTLERDLATLRVERQKDAERAEQQIAELKDAREAMTKEFRLLAEEVMAKHGQTFRQQNREQIEGLLNPLRQKIVEFQQGMTHAQQEAATGRATLAEQIRMLSERSGEMTRETLNLTRALKGRTQTQGAWGEMILSTILEKSGLREGEEYATQQSETMEDGRRLRPDVVVNLPNDHKIIVDSKVSLVAFEEFVNAEDEAGRAAGLKRHVDSLRGHIRDLSSKDYSRIAGVTPDYVIMFVPIEGAFAAALETAPDLTGFAIGQNITIATPTTLITLLRTVANLWQVERQQKNAEEIASRAGLLYDKFEGFVSDMSRIRKGLDSATQAHDQAMGKLSTGRGNLVNQAETLRQLGAKTKKRLPDELIEDAIAPELLEQD
ncbi:DNA recombination protein RmuC [Minwuia thermotolerans]|uniref:DNA recombination protein RmuC homolog n=1 Tax=Minwuia thermotolerans TaxID=2056226 RepID=A0A2M9G1W1_9PROT|nr:DNA recombination protein RmuC [Minwuia thermotolerans]PJK29686.1 DNA recombination protein RmuC [Minwuia thermotolerans]